MAETWVYGSNFLILNFVFFFFELFCFTLKLEPWQGMVRNLWELGHFFEISMNLDIWIYFQIFSNSFQVIFKCVRCNIKEDERANECIHWIYWRSDSMVQFVCESKCRTFSLEKNALRLHSKCHSKISSAQRNNHIIMIDWKSSKVLPIVSETSRNLLNYCEMLENLERV